MSDHCVNRSRTPSPERLGTSVSSNSSNRLATKSLNPLLLQKSNDNVNILLTRTRDAWELYSKSQTVLSSLFNRETHASDNHTGNPNEAQELLHEMKQVANIVHGLTVFGSKYTESSEIKSSLEVKLYKQQVMTILEDQNVDELLKKLNKNINVLKVMLDSTASFVPNESQAPNCTHSDNSNSAYNSVVEKHSGLMTPVSMFGTDHSGPALTTTYVTATESLESLLAQDPFLDQSSHRSLFEKTTNRGQENERLVDELRDLEKLLDSNNQKDTIINAELEKALPSQLQQKQQFVCSQENSIHNSSAPLANTTYIAPPQRTSTSIALPTAKQSDEPLSSDKSDILMKFMQSLSDSNNLMIAEQTKMREELEEAKTNYQKSEMKERQMTVILQNIQNQIDTLRTERDEEAKSTGTSDYVREYENQGLDEDGESLKSNSVISESIHSNRDKFNSLNQARHRYDDNKTTSSEDDLARVKVFDGTGNYHIFKTVLTSVFDQLEASFVIKYQLLLEKLSGEAATCLAPIIEADAETAIKQTWENLDEIYSSQDNKHDLLKKLKTLEIHNHDTVKMKFDLLRLQAILSQLLSKGFPSNDDRVTKEIAAKLPEWMRKKCVELMVDSSEEITCDHLVNHIKKCLRYWETDNDIMKNHAPKPAPLVEIPTTQESVYTASIATKSLNESKPENGKTSKFSRPLAYDPAKYRSEYYDPVTKTTLDGIYAPGSDIVNCEVLPRSFPFNNDENVKCKTCDGMHSAIRCPLTSTEFRRKAKERNLCPLCNLNHALTKCRSICRCGYCDGLHHMGGCPKKEFFRDPKNYPEQARPVETTFQVTTTKAKQI